MNLQTSRRGFLQAASAAAALLVVGVRPDGAFAAGSEATGLNPFVKVAPDGTVTVILKHFEMGQGTSTGLTTLVADELDADWSKVAIEFAPADNELYKNLFFGAQGTGGSTAMANSFMQYRQAGAAARAVLVEAAAKAWGSDPGAITVENGVISDGTNSGGFGDFVAAAAALTPPAEPAVKAPEAFTLIGRDHLPRKDTPGKIDGSAEFAIDQHLDGMVVAALVRPPKFGATLKGFDASGAAGLAGFVDAKAMPNSAGVIVYGKNTWAAFQARDAITAEWDFAAAETRSSDQMVADALALAAGEPAYLAREGSDLAATGSAIDGAAQVLEAEFTFPNLSHSPMEPLNCTIEPLQGGGVRVHDGCQFPGLTQPTVAAVLGIDPSTVEIRTVFAGGSFGRRAIPTSDYHVEAALAFQALGGTAPVKLVWSREDDIHGGYYRPLAVHKARIGLDADGRIAGWDHRVAAKSIFKGTPMEPMVVRDGIDEASVEGISDTHYAIPALSVGLTDFETPVTALWWRSVGHSHTGYVMESLIDMAAHAAGRDPVAYRLALLADGTPEQQRLAGVLQLAAEKAGWGQPLPEGHAQGIAVHKSFNTYVAEVVEVSGSADALKIEKVTCAVDCGVPVNPDVIRAQMEGGIGYGLGHVMRGQITFTDGEVDQSNFPDYEPLRMGDIGAIEVHVMPSTEAPTGVGEPGVPPAGPALANAIFALTGKRVTRLPLAANGVSFA